MKIEEVRAKNDHELEFELAQMKKELFDLRFKSTTQVLNNPARIRLLRRTIARVNTIVHERSTGVRGQEPH
jgi:large subunit ribosomal protein L29